MTMSTTVNPGVTSWTVVQVRCRECGQAGPVVDKEPGTTVRITFTCTRSHCRIEQRAQV